MKPSGFLKNRMGNFAAEVAGDETVRYYVLSEGQRDSLTGTVDESNAYPTVGVGLTALIDYSPSDAVRKKIGASIEFDATLQIPLAQITDKSITLKIGDAFTLEDGSDKYYVKRVVSTHQVDDAHLMKFVAVSRRHGRR